MAARLSNARTACFKEGRGSKLMQPSKERYKVPLSSKARAASCLRTRAGKKMRAFGLGTFDQ